MPKLDSLYQRPELGAEIQDLALDYNSASKGEILWTKYIDTSMCFLTVYCIERSVRAFHCLLMDVVLTFALCNVLTQVASVLMTLD